MKPENVIIVGAPRSGTNMLRDVLTSFDGVSTWPCDEINLIWRHGNRAHESDEFGIELATASTRRYIRSQFDRQRKRSGAPIVVEKTCATSLRVGFTHAVLPDAKYLFIVRDGIDAAMSAAERWNAPLDLRYTAKKVRFVPPSDLAYYGSRFIANRVRKSASATDALATWWGPKVHGYRDLMRRYTLNEVCALQWAACVDASYRDLAAIDQSQVLQIRYEEFVENPAQELERVTSFLGLTGDVEGAVASVSRSSVGKGRRMLDPAGLECVQTLIGPTLGRVGYVG